MATGLAQKKVRIGVDVSILQKLQGGISYYIFFLLDELIRQKPECDFILYAMKDLGDGAHFEKYPNVTLRVLPFLSSLRSVVWRNTTLPFVLRRDRLDVFWITHFYLPFVIPKGVKRILTVYDFVPFLFPETVSFLHGIYHRAITRANLLRADFRVVISEGTGRRMKELFGMEQDAVVYPPQKSELVYQDKTIVEPFLKERSLEYNQYLVSVSTWEPRKNFLLLTRIYCSALEKYGPGKVMPLVIVGGGGWKNGEMMREFEGARQKYPGHFKIAGRVSDSQLALYLSGARYYIALSMYEGYGMPIAEARHCRTPVICMDVPEMREAAEGDAIFVTPGTVEAELPKYMLRGDVGEKKPLKLGYASNAASAAKLAALIS